MFRRLVFENNAALFTIGAFITAVSIYAACAWRALRMKRPQIERFANLPFTTATPASVGAQTTCALDSTAGHGRSQPKSLQP